MLLRYQAIGCKQLGRSTGWAIPAQERCKPPIKKCSAQVFCEEQRGVLALMPAAGIDTATLSQDLSGSASTCLSVDQWSADYLLLIGSGSPIGFLRCVVSTSLLWKAQVGSSYGQRVGHSYADWPQLLSQGQRAQLLCLLNFSELTLARASVFWCWLKQIGPD